MYVFGKKSQRRLVGVNPILAYVVSMAITRTSQDFTVFEGVRTIDRQRKLYSDGKSKTLRSKHLTGNAVDLVVYKNGKITWDNSHGEFFEINKAVKSVVKELQLENVIQWGYEQWGWDMPHYQIIDTTYDIRKILPKATINMIVKK
jgi:peptidoglycan L-alanyl-D-glutamate endopeptidase CwlK